MTGNGGLIAEEGLVEEMFLPMEGTLGHVRCWRILFSNSGSGWQAL